MTNRIYAHRNLNAAKRDWFKWVYSYGFVKGAIGRGKLIGHSEAITLTSVDANCQQSGLAKIRDGAHRSVSAWLIGTPTTQPIAQGATLRRFSINPTKGQLQFTWSDDKTLVQFPLKMVQLKSDGCFAVID